MPGQLSRRHFLAGLLGGAVGLGAAGSPAVAQRAVRAGTRPPVGLTIIPREMWDPHGTARPTEPPRYGPPVRRAVVHHTVRYRRYRKDHAAHIVRRLSRFHIQERGFSDVGYHFLVDRFGRAYEGRVGGIDRPVVGAHSEGHNGGTFGVALIGDHQRDPVSEPALRTLERLLAWKLSLHEVPPRGRSAGQRGRPGATVTPVTLTSAATSPPTIIGHRDTKATLCPGRHLYAALDGVVERVATMMERGVVLQAAGPPPTVALPRRDRAVRTARTPEDPEEAAGSRLDGALPAAEGGATALGLGLTGLGLALSGDRHARGEETDDGS